MIMVMIMMQNFNLASMSEDGIIYSNMKRLPNVVRCLGYYLEFILYMQKFCPWLHIQKGGGYVILTVKKDVNTLWETEVWSV